MKKLLAFLLAAAMLSVTACGNIRVVSDRDDENDASATTEEKESEETAAESVEEATAADTEAETAPSEPQITAAAIFNTAIENTRTLDYLAADSNVDTVIYMTATANGMTQSLTANTPQTQTVVIDQTDPDAPIMHFTQTSDLSQLGQGTNSLDMFIDREWVYYTQTANGIATSFKYSVEAVGGFDKSTIGCINMLQPIPEAYLADKDLVPAADGSYTTSVEVNLDDFEKIYSELIDSLASSYSTSVDGITLSGPKAEITVKDGYVTNYRLFFVMKMVVDGVDVEYNFDFDINYKDHGKAVTLTPPAGAENYPDYTEYAVANS